MRQRRETMGRHRFIPHDRLARARWLYERTRTPVPEIAAALGMSTGTFYWRVRHKWKWIRRLYMLPRTRPRRRKRIEER